MNSTVRTIIQSSPTTPELLATAFALELEQYLLAEGDSPYDVAGSLAFVEQEIRSTGQTRSQWIAERLATVLAGAVALMELVGWFLSLFPRLTKSLRDGEATVDPLLNQAVDELYTLAERLR